MGGDYSGSQHSCNMANVNLHTEDFLLSGIGSDSIIKIADSDDWALGSGDFTIEIFGAKFDSVSTFQYILSQLQTAGDQQTWLFRLRGDLSPKKLQFLYSTDGASGTVLEATWAPTAGVAYDLALERSGSTLRFYADGTMLDSAAISGSLFNGSSHLWIGDSPHDSGTKLWLGRFAACRITKGTARYATDTSYTVPSLPLPTS